MKKNSGTLLAVCFIAIILLALCSGPIVLSIEQEGNGNSGTEGVYTFYKDEYARYYLADGGHPFDVRVIYLNKSSELLGDALREGHITLEDLERFDIDYGIIPKNS